MKAVVAAFNQEKALVRAFSVITDLRMELFEALIECQPSPSPPALVATSGALIIPGQGGGGAQLTGEGVTLSPPSHGRSPFSHPGSHFPGGHAAVNHLVVGLMSPLVG